MENYHIGVYWGVRKEDVDVCTRRAVSFFEQLARCDPIFSRWFRLGRSRKEALRREVKPDQETLRRLFLKGRHYTDFGHELMAELGFSIGLWNGGSDKESVSIFIGCGGYTPFVSNSCEISGLESDSPAASRLLQVSTLTMIMECMIINWEPDWGRVNSLAHFAITPSERKPKVGWITYLRESGEKIPPLPFPVSVKPIGMLGSLIILTEERFTASNPKHVELAATVSEILDQAGLRRT